MLGVARSVRSFAELTTEQAPVLLTSAVVEQRSPQIAANDEAVMAVWVENDATFGRLLPLAGRPPECFAISAPTAGWSPPR